MVPKWEHAVEPKRILRLWRATARGSPPALPAPQSVKERHAAAIGRMINPEQKIRQKLAEWAIPLVSSLCSGG